ncbi:MAG: hypothetical protein GWP10_13475 [Nitrospiraceae bacterium]|nr:hypothetical protein [Nitrospiraceae bacterium]
MYDSIKLTAYNAEEADRLPRLARVIGYVQALADYYGNKQVLGKVSELHDHKGTMTVFWKEQPTDGEKEMFLKAWYSDIGDGADNVEHQIKNI